MSNGRISTALAIIVSLLALAAHAFGQAQNPKPPEGDDVVRVYSDLVQTDVMVFDKQGRFVNGLKREDFELKIDGKPRPVEFFERIAAGTSDEDVQLSAARGTAATGKGTSLVHPVPLDRGRTVFFYVDDLHLSPVNLLQMRKLLLRFVEQDMGQNDLAAITSASGSIGFLQQLSDNKAVLRAAVNRLSPRSFLLTDIQRPPMSEYHALQIDRYDRDVTDYFIDALLAENPSLPRELAGEQVRARANQLLRQAVSITTNTLAGLESLVRSLSKLPGRKLVFFISDGFFLDDRNSDALGRLRRVTSAAARSGVVIYSMDARGLVASLADLSVGVPFDPTGRLDRGTSGELLASQDAMNALARDTGGRTIFNTNALNVGLTTALKETSTYYLLAWRPDHEAAATDKFRRIAVSVVGQPDLTVRVRQGFFDRESPALGRRAKDEPQAEPSNKTEPAISLNVLRESLQDTYPNAELPVATNLGFLDTPLKGIMLTVSMLVRTDSLTFANEAGKLKGALDIGGAVYNDQGKRGATFDDRLTVTAPSLNLVRPANKEVVYNYQVYLPAGLYQVRVGVRDPASGKVGTAYEWIEIPNLAAHKLTMSSLITGELPAQRDATNVGQDAVAQAALRVDHRFHRNSTLRFIVYVYNAALSPADSRPDLGIQVQILRDREPVLTTPSKKLSTEGSDQFARVPYGGDLPLEGLAAGRYVFRLLVVDRVAKTSASQEVRFEIN